MKVIKEQENYSTWLEDDSKQFTREGLKPVPRKIVCAANRITSSGLVVASSRHFSPVMRVLLDALGPAGKGVMEQGFIDQYDQFLSREDAKRIALANRQPLVGEDFGRSLFSENLY